MRRFSFASAVALLFVAHRAGAVPPAPPPPPHALVATHAPPPHVPASLPTGAPAVHAADRPPTTLHAAPALPPAAPLFAPRAPTEAPDAFFARAAREIATGTTTATGQLSPRGHEALAELAHAAGREAIRNVVVGGGVLGSQSGNGYVHYYRNGWNDANLRLPRRTEPAPQTEAPAPPPPPAHRDPVLEAEVRALLARTPDGQRALEQLAHAKTTILFREGGGTSNNGDDHELYVDVKMRDGVRKPVSWLALAVAHEASHAHDDATGATPRTVSALRDDYAAKKAQASVPMALRIALVKDRQDYVERQVDGEARAMTSETRLRRDLEAQGVDFARLSTNLLDPYNDAVTKVYAAAGVPAPR